MKTKTISKKTENIETMKTRINQVVLAAFFSLIFISGNVNAKGTELIASDYETIEESELEMEDWMINENYWNTSETTVYFEEITEESMELEDWMFDNNLWERNSLNLVESETELNLESWMICEHIWNR